MRRSGHHRNQIDTPFPARFEQQRYVHHHQRTKPVSPQKHLAGAIDGRMHQSFQPLQFYVVTENPLAERRSEENTSELQSLMRTSYAVTCLKTTNTYKRR